MDDSDLVVRTRAGEASAWEALVRRHQQSIFRLAYLLLGDAADAEDVAQETFIRAYQHLTRFDIERPLRPWLLRIATNLSRNRLRGIGRYLDAVRRWLLVTPQPIGDARHEAARAWEAEALWQAVRRLQRIDQQVIYLRYFLELSETETAEVLGVAPGTIKSRSHRALKRLRGVVEQDFPALAEGWTDERARL